MQRPNLSVASSLGLETRIERSILQCKAIQLDLEEALNLIRYLRNEIMKRDLENAQLRNKLMELSNASPD